MRRRHFLHRAGLATGAAALGPSGALFAQTSAAAIAGNRHALQQAFVDLRFGMFLHFNMGTFHDREWVDPGKDPASFNPVELDCRQWAKAARSAGMTFGVLTTKHHDGFCLWPSAATDYTVASSSIPNRDVFAEFCEAFRAEGLIPCPYFSIWDRQHQIQDGRIDADKIAFIKAQLSELLGGNYGQFPLLIIDGWNWQMGHLQVPYGEIREHILSLQPHILISDHNSLTVPFEVDLIYFEEPKGIFAPEDNPYASIQGQNIVDSGWFWHPATPTARVMSLEDIVAGHLGKLEPRWCNFLLNCPPNPNGLLDGNIVSRLREVGEQWRPDSGRAPLPAQPDVMQYRIDPLGASASSGNAAMLIDTRMKLPKEYQTHWIAEGTDAAHVTFDLGAEYANIELLHYLPRQDGEQVNAPRRTAGNITRWHLGAGTDGENFRQVAAGSWEADKTIKVIRFDPPLRARHLRLFIEATAEDQPAIISDLTVGALTRPPRRLD